MRGNVLALSASLLVLMGCATGPTAMQKADKAYLAQDYATAFAGYQPLADAGDSAADLRISYMYRWGEGVAKDAAAAQHWEQKGARDGSNSEAVTLGNRYLLTRGGAPDYAQALQWFQLAADRDDAYAELELSICYEHGLGVARDHAAALHWLDRYVAGNGVDDAAGFIAGVRQALRQTAQPSISARHFSPGVVTLSFQYQDGRAVAVAVVRSSGNAEADAAMVDAMQKALLPPVLPSLSRAQHFQVAFNFGEIRRKLTDA